MGIPGRFFLKGPTVEIKPKMHGKAKRENQNRTRIRLRANSFGEGRGTIKI
jgi:hypothetical protein